MAAAAGSDDGSSWDTVFTFFRIVICCGWMAYCGLCWGAAMGFMYAKRHPDPNWRMPRDKGNTMEAMFGERHLTKWIKRPSLICAALGFLLGLLYASWTVEFCSRSNITISVLGVVGGALTFPALALPNPWSTYVEPTFRLLMTPVGKCAEELNDLLYGERVLRETPYWGGVIGLVAALSVKLVFCR